MKKISLSLVIVGTLGTIFSGCGEDSNLSSNNTQSNPELKSEIINNSTVNKATRAIYRSLSSDIPTAWGFDYPIGNKGYDDTGNKISLDEHISSIGMGSNYNVARNEEYNLDKGYASENSRGGTSSTDWYNLNDVGNFLWEDDWKYTGGLHPGEDWNLPNGDAGEAVYSVADGKIVYLRTTYPNTTSYGWTIVIEHKLPDNSNIYSIYTHITSDNNTNGAITNSSNKSDFRYQVGKIVHRGDLIARIADKTSADHLHFEIRNKIDLNDLYPNDNGHGYYSHDQSIIYKKTITKENVLRAFENMREDGILDPSDFIDDHRDIYPWVGNGSIISYHGESHDSYLSGDSQYPYGITQDISRTHTQTNLNSNNIPNLFKQAGFFQWQVSTSCEKLKIDHSGLNNNVDLTIGYWGSREHDITFKNVTLPFILGEENTGYHFNNNGRDWRVVAITFNKSTINYSNTSDIPNTLSATCTNESESTFNGTKLRNQHIMIGEHQWNGNASIISRIFKDYSTNLYSGTDNWPFGAFNDVTMVHKNQYKPVVFFQWMSSDICSELEIDVALDSSEKQVTLGIKNWADNTYSNQKVTLPYTVKSERLWSVIKVAFDEPVSKDARVTARCKEL